MDLLSNHASIDQLPKLGSIDVNRLWESIPMLPINCNSPMLDRYMERHDAWTEKIRLMGLDGGLLVDFRVLPALDKLVQYLYSQSGWTRPEIYVVSDMGRKGIDSWSAVSVVSDKRPVILLGTQLVELLNESELAFIIGHETAHLIGYNNDWRKDMSLSFLIRELVETNRHTELHHIVPGIQWQTAYLQIMANCRAMEMRCDRLGLLLCGDFNAASRSLLAVTLKSEKLARSVDLHSYLAVQEPLLATSPVAGPISVNAGHPFLPFRIKSLLEFVQSGSFNQFSRMYMR